MVPVDPSFEPNELLFRRIKAEWLEQDRSLAPAYVAFPEFSVDRSKYRSAGDTIRNFPGMGVAQFRVADIPEAFTPPDSPITYSWIPVHLPNHAEEPDNDAHSHVRTFKNGAFNGRKIKNKMVKMYFRDLLSRRIRMVIQPVA